MGYVRSKTRSPGQMLEKPWSRDQTFGLILMVRVSGSIKSCTCMKMSKSRSLGQITEEDPILVTTK